MPETKTYVAMFGDIETTAEGIEHLHDQGVGDERIQVISSFPIGNRILGRPKPRSFVPWFALAGVLVGWGVATFFAAGMTNLYPLKVGRQGLVNGAPTVVMLFEMMVLFMLAFTFIGVFLSSNLPTYKPQIYLPEITNGKIAVIYDITGEDEDKVKEDLTKVGASSVAEAERRAL